MGDLEKKSDKFYVLCLQDSGGRIVDLKYNHNYDNLLLKAMELSKISGATWSIFTSTGRLCDSSYQSQK